MGILVDLAHASPETVLGALKVATQPVIVSHTGLDSRTGGNSGMAEMMKPHLISKERAKVVVFAENIKAMVDAAGIDTSGSAPTQICSPRVLAKAPTRHGQA